MNNNFDPSRLLGTVLVQRLILAFTTGLFLACAANISG